MWSGSTECGCVSKDWADLITNHRMTRTDKRIACLIHFFGQCLFYPCSVSTFRSLTVDENHIQGTSKVLTSSRMYFINTKGSCCVFALGKICIDSKVLQKACMYVYIILNLRMLWFNCRPRHETLAKRIQWTRESNTRTLIGYLLPHVWKQCYCLNLFGFPLCV